MKALPPPYPPRGPSEKTLMPLYKEAIRVEYDPDKATWTKMGVYGLREEEYYEGVR